MSSYELQHRDLVVVGSGMAAIRLVETLRRRGDRRSIAVLGAERSLPYNRIMLSPLLSGDSAWQHLVSHPAEWYERNAIDLHLGCAVDSIDCNLRRVHCADGFSLQYTDLVFATGSRAALPSLPGIELAGVSAFRDVNDVARLQKAARQGGEAVVMLDDGTELPAQLVVAATGIEPVSELAQRAGLPVARGIVVDAHLRTADAHVYALGECCELNGETVGLVAPIWQQVDVLAANLCGERQQFTAQPYVTMLKVSGIDVHTMGEIELTENARMLTFQDRDHGIYKKLIVRDDKVVGALLFGDIADSQMFFNLITRHTRIGSDRCRLLLAGELPVQQSAATA